MCEEVAIGFMWKTPQVNVMPSRKILAMLRTLDCTSHSSADSSLPRMWLASRKPSDAQPQRSRRWSNNVSGVLGSNRVQKPKGTFFHSCTKSPPFLDGNQLYYRHINQRQLISTYGFLQFTSRSITVSVPIVRVECYLLFQSFSKAKQFSIFPCRPFYQESPRESEVRLLDSRASRPQVLPRFRVCKKHNKFHENKRSYRCSKNEL